MPSLQQRGKSDKMPTVEIHTGKKLREIGILKFGKSNAAAAASARQRWTLICPVFSFSIFHLCFFSAFSGRRNQKTQALFFRHISKNQTEVSSTIATPSLHDIVINERINVSIYFVSTLSTLGICHISKRPLRNTFKYQ